LTTRLPSLVFCSTIPVPICLKTQTSMSKLHFFFDFYFSYSSRSAVEKR
jgi:hypothetical protein